MVIFMMYLLQHLGVITVQPVVVNAICVMSASEQIGAYDKGTKEKREWDEYTSK